MEKHCAIRKLKEAYQRLMSARTCSTQASVIEDIDAAKGLVFDITEAYGRDIAENPDALIQ